jgi:putative peptide zinc metalloprotease protein
VPPPLGSVDATATAPPRGGDPGVRRPAPTLGAATVPVRADGVELFGAVPGSGYLRPPTIVRRADGQVVQLTPLLDAVVRELDPGRTYAEVATAVGARTGRHLEPEDVAFLVARLRPLGLVRGPAGEEPELHRAAPLLGLRCRIVITDPALTRRLTAPFAVLFHPAIVLAVLAAFALCSAWLLFDRGLAGATYAAFSEPHALLAVFALTVLSAGLHEFGHAAACRYSGATPGAMGFGLYLVWPAFYTDVTDSYRLGRAARLRVDLGGLYLNAVVSVVTFAVWAATGWEAALLLIASQLLQMVRQLVPLVRFDGYHILADLIGVPDLFAHLGPTLRRLIPGQPKPAPTLKRWARVCITVWVAVVVPVLLTVLVLMVVALPRLAATAADGLATQFEVLGANWAAGEIAAVGVRVLSILALLVPVLSVTYLLGRILVRTVRRVRGWVDGRRGRRAVAFTGALLAAAVTASAWLTPGGHPPIGPDETGGRVQDAIPFLAAFTDAARQQPEETPADAPAVQPDGRRGVPAPMPAGAAGEAVGGPSPAPASPAAAEPATAEPARSVAVAGPRPVAAAPDPHGGPPPGGGVVPPPPVDRGDWPFPWDRPAPVGPGDARALVVNTRDRSTQRDVSISSVWVTGGDRVTSRNEALAYASCRDCRSIAAAFQVVYVVGRSPVVTPVNLAVAANHGCERCVTHAVANQLVVTLRAEPTGATRGQLTRVVNQLRSTANTATSAAVLLQAFRAAEAELLDLLGPLVLTEAGTSTTDAATTGDAEVGAGADAGAETGDPAGAEAGPDPGAEPAPADADAAGEAAADGDDVPGGDPSADGEAASGSEAPEPSPPVDDADGPETAAPTESALPDGDEGDPGPPDPGTTDIEGDTVPRDPEVGTSG